MTSQNDTPNTPNTPEEQGETASAPRRPLGALLKRVDRLIRREFDELFAGRGLTRGDWRRLNLIAGLVDDPEAADRLERRPDRVERLVARGWVAGRPGERRLTDDGRTALDELTGQVSGLRARIAGTVSDEDFRTTLRTLASIADELGGADAGSRPDRPRRGHHGRGRRGRRFRGGYAPVPGFGPEPWFGPAPGACGHGHQGRAFQGREPYAGCEHPHHHGHPHHEHPHGADRRA
ncbi:MarR family winged helix-turn-helix transcriptional regulator [Agromyces archimandritae]|uniref:MarR family transcriptional regulator n=1 Tax=Agromyces archimandritae TaxID=2781962 RepID=A0A975IMC4_9MICO|nr:MarR family winged helix-turn-helix transcriptional regulator [Agromyces archimandritae]QTX03367.1 hypothetical protein G127AT_08210 [Agromyces archimandritae]